MSTTAQDQIATQGFVIVRQILSPAELSELREAAARTTELARAGKWPHIRTVGKQFPPWPSEPGEDGIWGVQGLMDPALPDSAAFTRSYFSPAVLGVAADIMDCSPAADLVMELFNMLVRPDRDFELRWHRDDVPAEATPEEERARLLLPRNHAQWNLALYDDDSLVVVPGSHVRPRTPAERAAGPYDARMPGQAAVRLRAGDVVFYDNNILHRGVYDSGRERMSLHGSVGHASAGALRARNVLQHGVGAWVDRCDLSVIPDPRQRATAEAMRARLVKLGRESGDVGYSLTG